VSLGPSSYTSCPYSSKCLERLSENSERATREGAFHNPAPRQDLTKPRRGISRCQSVCCPSLDHSSAQILATFSGVGFGVRCTTSTLKPSHIFCPVLAPTLITCIHPQVGKAWKAITYTLQQQLDPILIGDFSAHDLGFFEHQSLCIHQEMALSGAHLLATAS
jgi:hypothetical protein